MKYALYEDPHTHRFALLPLPDRFVEDDPVPMPARARWFDSREAAVAALPDLLDADERSPEAGLDDAAPVSGDDRPH